MLIFDQLLVNTRFASGSSRHQSIAVGSVSARVKSGQTRCLGDFGVPSS
ncbi:hypothetical protein HanLR1_Chr03g0081701 [Helianthus annuus]|nr:hypothetical protein HanLR1_Chr03g0081701 [Helianthus annuus]